METLLPSAAAVRAGWLLGGLLLLLLWPSTLSGATPERCNVLLLVSDDQRPDTVGILGDGRVATPHLDALARAGTVFRRATCANPLCVPSRAELLSGLTSFHNGFFSTSRLREEVVCWPQAMQRAGYRTGYVGKWHTSGRPSTRGYTEVHGLFSSGKAPDPPQLDRHGRPVTGYVGWQFQTDRGERFPERGVGLTPDISSTFADAAIAFLEQPAEQPFFLHVNFTAPHDPLFLPPGYEKRYDPEAIPLPPNFAPEHPFDHGNLRGRDEQLWGFPRTVEEVRDELAVYYALITHLDEQIGRILRTLDERNFAENTLVIFTSDHGMAIGSHGLRGKQNMYEHTINVPLILRGPGVPAGARREAQCYLRDLYPTVCELTGVPHPPLDGRSLAGVLRGEQDEIYPFIVGYFADSQRMIRSGDWKLIRYPRIDREQLFHVGNDPAERHDQIANPAHAAIADKLRQQLTAWLAAQEK